MLNILYFVNKSDLRVWHLGSCHLYCVVCAMYLRLVPRLFFSLSRLAMYIWLRHTSSLSVLLSLLPWFHQNSLKMHISESNSRSLQCFYPDLTVEDFFHQFWTFLTLIFAFCSNYCYQASFSCENLPSVAMFYM